MDWSANGWRSAFRIELRVQAIGFASRGWPVLPGTYPADARGTGRSGNGAVDLDESGPTPVHADWQQRSATDLDTVASLWSEEPFSLLVATGTVVDALEVDVERGKQAARALRAMGAPAPIIATPQGRWYFLAAPGQRLRPELAESGQVTLHSTGSWVPMPPTTFQHGVVHWRVKPEVCGWTLPSSDVVQDALCAGSNDIENVVGLVATGG